MLEVGIWKLEVGDFGSWDINFYRDWRTQFYVKSHYHSLVRACGVFVEVDECHFGKFDIPN